MAFKKYSYYNKGNKIAIVESDTYSTGGNLAVAHCTLSGYSTKDTCEAAGGQWIPSSSSIGNDTSEKYISPKETVTDGLEIEFSYAPNYNLSSSNTITYYFSGYGSNGTNLVLFADEDMSSIHSADDYILINEGPYAGIHQVKTTPASASRVLVTKTVFEPTPSMISITADIYSNETIQGDTSADDVIIENFKAQLPSGTNYIFLNLSENAGDNKLWRLASTQAINGFNVDKEYDFNDSTLVWDESAATMDSEVNDAVEVYYAYKKALSVRKADYMIDESFDLDLTPYQSQAIVYYLKAKISEDMRDAEGRQYFMRLFNKQISKAMSSKKKGIHIIQGNGNLL
tara:strand:- start:7664 stop:8692 length:1029 start_codon:yes stop_codon:yes gene_type:complete